MFATLALSALFGAQAVISVPAPEPVKEVAYESLMEGRAEEAVRALELRLAQEPGDPATLINLGTAYVRTGKPELAAKAYRAAMDSSTSYQLELADGSWVESREAARRGLNSLPGATFAAVDR